VPRDIGTAESNGIDLVSEILKNGWGKSKENKREPTPEDLRRKKLEDEAREAGKGIWKTDAPVVSFDSIDIHEMYLSVLPDLSSPPHNARGPSDLLIGMEGQVN